MKITYCGHASLLVERNGVSLVIDPWFSATGAFVNSWFQFPDNTDIDLGPIRAADYVFITHSHADHLDLDFIRSLSTRTKILIPQYSNGRLRNIVSQEVKNQVIELPSKKSFTLAEGFDVCPVPQSVPYQEDCALVIKTPERTILNANDTKIAPHDLAWIKENYSPEYLFIQYSGASWHPFVYNYSIDRKIVLAQKKIKNKYHHVWATLEGAGAKFVVPFAGPPCFLNDDHFDLNFSDDSYFPTIRDFLEHAEAKGSSASVCCLTPAEVMPWLDDYSDFSRKAIAKPPYAHKREYLEEYRARRKELIKESLQKNHPDDGLPNFAASKKFFEPLMSASAYLRGRIGGAVLLESVGRINEAILLDFPKAKGQVRNYAGEPWIYKFTISAPILKAALSGKLLWEDLFLSLRFKADRNPDSYNEHLTVFFRFASPDVSSALINYEEFERYHRQQDISASFVCEHEGKKYSVQRYCPHAWGDLSKGMIENGMVVCPGHGWAFSLKDGRCKSNQAAIRVEPIG